MATHGTRDWTQGWKDVDDLGCVEFKTMQHRIRLSGKGSHINHKVYAVLVENLLDSRNSRFLCITNKLSEASSIYETTLEKLTKAEEEFTNFYEQKMCDVMNSVGGITDRAAGLQICDGIYV